MQLCLIFMKTALWLVVQWVSVSSWLLCPRNISDDENWRLTPVQMLFVPMASLSRVQGCFMKYLLTLGPVIKALTRTVVGFAPWGQSHRILRSNTPLRSRTCLFCARWTPQSS